MIPILTGLYSKFSIYLTTALILIIGVLYFLNGNLKDRIKELAMEQIVSSVNIKTLNSMIDKQNLSIKKNEIEFLKKEKEYKEKEKIIIKFRDKIIYKEVDVDRSNCEDIKKTINNIRKDFLQD